MDDTKWNILASYDFCNFCNVVKIYFTSGSFKVVAVFYPALQSREKIKIWVTNIPNEICY